MSLITVRLDKGNSPNLGFRLQGGKDFGTPLVIQKVNGGSPAERAGLAAGDSVIKINTTDVFNLRHKDAQDVIIRAGPSFEVTVQRGGSVWKPSVVPTGPLSNASPTVTKTSLAASKQDNFGSVGTGHNVSAKPFSPQLNGAVNGGPKLVNNQYNSPLKLYSEESIAETLSAQTEVLSTGALGVNFKKNEKSYDATNSAVYRMLQEAEKEPRSPEPAVTGRHVTSPRSNTPLDGDHSRLSSRLGDYPNSYNPNQEGVTKCTECERVIVGVFVRIKDKNLHVECFKCSTCGTSLKNVGYYNINNKLYCDVHAKLAARTNPPAPNLVPVTVPPGGKAPANAISSALASHSLPSPSPLSPKSNLAQPFQPSQDDRDSNLAAPLQNLSLNLISEPNYNSNKLSSLNNSTPLSFNKFLNKAGNYSSAPKPFSSVSAPTSSPNYNTLPRAAPAAAPLSPVVSAPAQSFSPASSAGRSVYSFVWPPPPEEPEGSTAPTACPLYVPPETHLKVIPKPKRDNPSEELYDQEMEDLTMYQQPKMSICSQEVSELTGRRSAAACIETIAETLETQRLIESVMKTRPRSPPPLPAVEPLPQPTLRTVCEMKGEFRKPTDYTPNTMKSQVDNLVPQSWEPPMTQALRTIPDAKDPFKELQATKFASNGFASALSIAPSEPFNPQPLYSDPVPLPEETVPYFPPKHPLQSEKKEPKPEEPPTFPTVYEMKGELKKPTDFTPNTIECKLKSQIENSVPQSWESPMVQALRTIPETKDDPFKMLPTTKFSSTGLASALSIAPSEPFTPHPLHSKPVPLPEETVPYFPPEHPLEIEKKEPKPEKPDSMFVKALQTAPDRPFTPVSAPVKKKKDPADELFKDIPKPQVRLSMREALTTASDRPYSPFVAETAKVEPVKETRRENLQKVLKPPVLPPSFNKPVEEKPQAPKPFPISIHEKHEEKEIDVKTSKVIEKHKTESTVEESVESVEEDKNQGMYPLFKGFSCSFGNKTEHSHFSIEISTTPPIINVDGSQAPTVKVSRTGASTESVTETITEETKKHEKLTEQKKLEKQAEQVQLKKPLSLASALHKPERLPQYQINLSDNLLLEENLQIKQKIVDGRAEKAKVLPPPKPPREFQTKPVITVQPGETNLSPEQSFKPVVEEKAPNLTFSPRPRPVTPSMINKPPSVLPYYQANLVAHECKAPEVNLLDPGSPNISRSPSPCPDRSASPLPFKQGPPRPKSPAAGPPPNPLATGEPLPKPKNARMEQAKRNVSSFLPQYREKMEVVEKVPQTYSMQEEAQNPTLQIAMFEGKSVEDSKKAQIVSEQIGQASVSTAMLEQSHSAHLEQMRKSQSQSLESDGEVQIQRKKTVTEEFEHSQKSRMVQIERNVTQPFKQVKNLEEQAMMGMHVTNPHPIVSPFLKQSSQQAVQCPKLDCVQQSCPRSECGACPRTQAFKHVPSPSSTAPIKHVPAPSGSGKSTQSVNKPKVPLPNAGAGSGGGRQAGAVGVAPKRGRGVLNTSALAGARIPLCASCHSQISYEFLANLNKETQRSSIYMQVGENNPSYGQINITIPVSTSPQLDSKGSSPRSDYSSQSSNSSKNANELARDKFLQEMRANEPHSALYSQVTKPKPTKLFTTSEQNSNLPDNLTFTNRSGELITDNNNTKPPVCCHCNNEILRGPFITALGKIWCPEHFICATPSCRRPLQDLGFVEEQGQLYCEYCFEQYLAPPCAKCGSKIKGDCLKAIGKNFHPECFCCFYCGKLFGNSPFFLEDGSPYCEADWNELFTTKCFACGFPVEAGDRWVEALNNNYHSQCFNCTMCKKNLEGQSFFAKGGRPFCKNHAR